MSYLKHKDGSIEASIKEMSKHLNDSAYQDMFKKELEKAGKGIGAMSDQEKKNFFNKIDKKYKAKSEELGKEDEPKVKKIIDKLKGASQAHAGQAKDLEKAMKEETIVEKIEGLEKKAEKSGISYSILKQVYDRGMAAYKTGHRPGTTAQQWAFARVNSFITKGSGTWGKADKDLADKVRGSKKESVNESTDINFMKGDGAEVSYLKRHGSFMGGGKYYKFRGVNINFFVYYNEKNKNYVHQLKLTSGNRPSNDREYDKMYDVLGKLGRENRLGKLDDSDVDIYFEGVNEMPKDKAYAIGMATAKKKYNDEPPLEKKTIKKGHEIGDKLSKMKEDKAADMERARTMRDKIADLQAKSNKLDKSTTAGRQKDQMVRADMTSQKLKLNDLMKKIQTAKPEPVKKEEKEPKSYKSFKKEQEKKGNKTMTDKPMNPVDTEPKLDPLK